MESFLDIFGEEEKNKTKHDTSYGSIVDNNKCKEYRYLGESIKETLGIKELKKQIEKLKKENNSLRRQVYALRKNKK